MRQMLCWTLLLLLALAGACKPKPTLATQTSTQFPAADSPGTETSPQAPIHGPDLQAAQAGGPVVIPDNADPGATLSRLSLELRRYVLRTRTAPRSFEDFVAKAQIQAPPPPPGKKYRIQSGTIILANQ